MLVLVYTCQKCHIVGNHMSRLKCVKTIYSYGNTGIYIACIQIYYFLMQSSATKRSQGISTQ